METDFNVGDCVCVGASGEKGKIVDIYKPLGTYKMYKVQSYTTGDICTASKSQLVKGLPDEMFNIIFEEAFQDEIDDNIIDTVSSTVAQNLMTSNNMPQQTSGSDASVNENAPSQLQMNPPPRPIHNANVSRFVETPDDVMQFVEQNENANTRQKTLSHQKLFEQFLVSQNEVRQIHNIPPSDLDKYISKFLLSVRQKNGQEYEPVTLRSMLSSFERYLKRHNYGTSLISGYEFDTSRKVLKSKQKDLKKQGLGNKPKAADAISDGDIDLLYECKQLGINTPESVLNTLWLNNTKHFGMRGGAAEHRALCWGDIQLCFDSEMNAEYLEYSERQTKTRTGVDVRDTRKSKPRMYATAVPGRCPIECYKFYADRRPADFCNPDHPFYLAIVTNKREPQLNEQWFLRLPVGRNKLNTIMKEMAKKADLPDREFKRFTNTSVRKHLCQKLLENNIPDSQAIHITGHKNPQSLNNYRQLTNKQKHCMSTLLANSKSAAIPTSEFGQPPAQNFSTSSSQSHHVASSVSHEMNTENIFPTIFQGAPIYGGNFNITINMCAKRKHDDDDQ